MELIKQHIMSEDELITVVLGNIKAWAKEEHDENINSFAPGDAPPLESREQENFDSFVERLEDAFAMRNEVAEPDKSELREMLGNMVDFMRFHCSVDDSMSGDYMDLLEAGDKLLGAE